jgi:hypothetical protein
MITTRRHTEQNPWHFDDTPDTPRGVIAWIRDKNPESFGCVAPGCYRASFHDDGYWLFSIPGTLSGGGQRRVDVVAWREDEPDPTSSMSAPMSRDVSLKPTPTRDWDLVDDLMMSLHLVWRLLVFERASLDRDDDHLRPLRTQILDRITIRLQEKIDRHLFGPKARFENEAEARAQIMSLARELSGASGALQLAAEALKAAGANVDANRAYQGHLRSRERANEHLRG